jgi:hypothetical protein
MNVEGIQKELKVYVQILGITKVAEKLETSPSTLRRFMAGTDTTAIRTVRAITHCIPLLKIAVMEKQKQMMEDMAQLNIKTEIY